MKLYLIVGCGRSGTSAVSGVFHLSGVNTGTPIQADEGNPKGYFEIKPVIDINERILKRHRTWVRDTLPTYPLRPTKSKEDREILDDIRSFLARFTEDNHLLSAIKDPRLSLTFRYWMGAIYPEDARVIHVKRRPKDVVASLVKRSKMTKDEARRLLEKYNYHIHTNIGGYPKTDAVWFEDLLEEPKKVMGCLIPEDLHPDWEEVKRFLS